MTPDTAPKGDQDRVTDTAARLDTCEHKQCIPFDRCLYGDNAEPTQPLDTAAWWCVMAVIGVCTIALLVAAGMLIGVAIQ